MDLSESTYKSKVIKLHQGAKSLLRNVIRHTDTHNRHLEEAEMWNLHSKIKNHCNSSDDKTDKQNERKYKNNEGRNFKDQDIQSSFLYDDREEVEWRRRGTKRAHMDDEPGDREGQAGSQSTYWLRQLHSFEEADPDRWGHSGFKELYPEVYDSDRSNTTETKTSKSHHKKKHKKKKKNEKEKPHSKKRKKRNISESEDEKNRDRKHKRRKKYSRSKDQDSSENDSSNRIRTKTTSKRKKQKRFSKVVNEKNTFSDSDRDS
ncbi:hypothetical protein Btru_046450 [Bulinus truncatus]|nr:hypothetical protein Btru_046450 [Bulinus truncatus]